MDRNKITTENINIAPSSMNRLSKLNINMETLDSNDKNNRSDGPDEHSESTTFKRSRTHTLLKHTWHILQDIPYVSPKKVIINLRKLNHINYLLQT